MARQVMDLVRGRYYRHIMNGNVVKLVDITLDKEGYGVCTTEGGLDPSNRFDTPLNVFNEYYKLIDNPEPFSPQHLQNMIPNIAEWLREEAKETEESFVKYSLTISGRVLGDLRISHSLCDNDFDARNVESHSLEAAMEEWKHRVGFKKRNQAALLTYAGDLKTE